VTNEHTEKFKKILRDKAPKTASDRMRYLLRALRDLNYELSTDKLQEYIIDLKEQSIYVAEHTAKALKLFIKHVIKDRNLYESFKTPRATEEVDKEIPSPAEVRAVAKAINWPPAKAYYCLLAESGLRPGELFKLKINEIDIEERTIKPKRITETKRAYIAFFSKPLQKYLKEVYLPYREEFINKYAETMKYLLGSRAEEWKQLLFPFKESTIRATIYDAMDKVLGRRFKLYGLRTFFATYMSIKKVPGQIIDIIQGREPPKQFKILVKHYLAFTIEELRKIYDKANLTTLENN